MSQKTGIEVASVSELTFFPSASAYFSGGGEGVLFPDGPRSLQRPEPRRRRRRSCSVQRRELSSA